MVPLSRATLVQPVRLRVKTFRFLASPLLLLSTQTAPAVAASAVEQAMTAMTGELEDIRQSCTGPIKVTVHDVALSDRVKGVHVVVSAPACLGQWGAYDYLLVQDIGGRWTRILGGPGPIRFSRSPGAMGTEIDLSALMGCELRFIWNGRTYLHRGTPQCAGGSKGAEWMILERVMRARGSD